jgi:hypothetical protein
MKVLAVTGLFSALGPRLSTQEIGQSEVDIGALMEVIDEHDVTVNFVHLRIKKPAPVG